MGNTQCLCIRINLDLSNFFHRLKPSSVISGKGCLIEKIHSVLLKDNKGRISFRPFLFNSHTNILLSAQHPVLFQQICNSRFLSLIFVVPTQRLFKVSQKMKHRKNEKVSNVLILMVLVVCSTIVQAQNQPIPKDTSITSPVTQTDSITMLLTKVSENAKRATVEELEWIAGDWELKDNQCIIEEYWMQPLGESMIGMTRNVSESEPVFVEYFRIQKVDSGIVLVAQPSSKSAIEYRLVELGDGIATFANPFYDYPQRIIYRKEGNSTLFVRLESTIRGQSRSVDVRYHRVRH